MKECTTGIDIPTLHLLLHIEPDDILRADASDHPSAFGRISGAPSQARRAPARNSGTWAPRAERDTSSHFESAAGVLEFLASLPSPKEILNLRPSERLERQVRELLEKSRTGTLSAEEERAWERYEFLEHLVRMAKTTARLKLGIKSHADA